MSPSLSPQASDIQEKLRREGIRHLFHWTSLENLPFIAQAQALCSKQTLEGMDLWPCPSPGGRGPSHNLDRHHGNRGSIGLNFTPYTPMVYHRKRDGKPLCFFIIKAEVATWRNVMFTDENAASNAHTQATGLEGLDLVKFDAIRCDPRPSDRIGWVKPVQAEVLVPDKIALDCVKKVVFISEASCAEGERLWGSLGHPLFKVEPEYFTDGYQRNKSVAFAYVDRLMLTDGEFDKETIDRPHEHCARFARNSTEYITAVVRTQAISGTQIRLTTEPTGLDIGQKEYSRGSYTNYARVRTDDLLDGGNSIVCYLNDIRWAQIDFEIIDG